MFGAKFTKDADISSIPFKDGVHEIIAKYVRSKILLNERVRPSELFEFFEENTEEFTELTKILDYSDGNALSGEVAEKYFFDCVKSLKLNDIDEIIETVRRQAEAETDLNKRKQLALELQQLLIQKKKIKSGER